MTATAKQPLTVRLGFDPNEICPDVFANDVARTIYLLWRINHIVDRSLESWALWIANRIRESSPGSPEELTRCFPGVSQSQNLFTDYDVKHFCADRWEFFDGTREVTYVVAANSE